MPSDEPVLRAEVARAIGHATAGVMGSGTWFSNAQGFATLKSLSPASQVGFIVIAEKRISFLQWNSTQSRFNVLRTVSYIEAKQVFVDKLGVARMLVVEGPNGGFDSFEFTKGFGMIGSATHAERALSLISAERALSVK